jgi:enoyl-CoA hydratase
MSGNGIVLMQYEHITFTVEDAVATVTLNRPSALNALSSALIGELDHVFDTIRITDQVRAVVITGAGDRAFAAGADVREFRALEHVEDAIGLAQRTHAVFEKLTTLPQPVIAAINGFALGGGLELALACDIRLAADSAMIGLPEVTLGLMPGWGGTTRLVRLIGPGATKLLIFSGRRIGASEAQGYGIVEQVFPKAELMNEARALALHLAGLPPLSLAHAKASIDHAHDVSLVEANRREAELFGQTLVTEDGREGVRAFIEKRSPQWKGR